MMKKVIIGVLLLYGFIAISHPVLWIFNRPIYRNLVTAQKQTAENATERLGPYRLKLEARAREELKKYKWIDERKEHAQIPIERAFDYYLRSHKP